MGRGVVLTRHEATGNALSNFWDSCRVTETVQTAIFVGGEGGGVLWTTI